MPPPAPWPFALARLLTAILFWPLVIFATGATALVLSFVLAGHVVTLGAASLVLALGGAGFLAAVRHYRWRTPPDDAMRSALCAALMLGTAANLPTGVAVFSPAGINDGHVIASLAMTAIGQILTYIAFRWSLMERRPEWL